MTFDDEQIRPAAGDAPKEEDPVTERRERRVGAGGIAAGAGAASVGIGAGAGLGAVAGDEILERIEGTTEEVAEEIADTSARRGEQIVRERIAEAEAAVQAASLDVFEADPPVADLPVIEIPESVRDAAGIIGDTPPADSGATEDGADIAGDDRPSIFPPRTETPEEPDDLPVSGTLPMPGGGEEDESEAGPGLPDFLAPPGMPSFPDAPTFAPPPLGDPADAGPPPPFAGGEEDEAPSFPGGPSESAPPFPDAPSSGLDIPDAPASPEGPDAGPVDGGPSLPDAPVASIDGPDRVIPRTPTWPEQATPLLPGTDPGDDELSPPSSPEGSAPDIPDSPEPPIDIPGMPPPGYPGESPDAGGTVPVQEPGHDLTYPYVTEWHADGGWAQVAIQNDHGETHLFRYYTDGRVYYIDEHGNAYPVDGDHLPELLYIAPDGTAYFSKQQGNDTVYFSIDTGGGVEWVEYEDIPIEQNGDIVEEYEYPRVVDYDVDEGWATLEFEDGHLTRHYVDGAGYAVDEHGNVLTNGLANPKLLYVAENGQAYFQMHDPDYDGYRYYLVDQDGGIEWVDPDDIPDYDYEEPVDDEEDYAGQILPEGSPAYFEFGERQYGNPLTQEYEQVSYDANTETYTYRFEDDDGGYNYVQVRNNLDGSWTVTYTDPDDAGPEIIFTVHAESGYYTEYQAIGGLYYDEYGEANELAPDGDEYEPVLPENAPDSFVFGGEQWDNPEQQGYSLINVNGNLYEYQHPETGEYISVNVLEDGSYYVNVRGDEQPGSFDVIFHVQADGNYQAIDGTYYDEYNEQTEPPADLPPDEEVRYFLEGYGDGYPHPEDIYGEPERVEVRDFGEMRWYANDTILVDARNDGRTYIIWYSPEAGGIEVQVYIGPEDNPRFPAGVQIQVYPPEYALEHFDRIIDTSDLGDYAYPDPDTTGMAYEEEIRSSYIVRTYEDGTVKRIYRYEEGRIELRYPDGTTINDTLEGDPQVFSEGTGDYQPPDLAGADQPDDETLTADGLLPDGTPDYFGDPMWVNPETDPRFELVDETVADDGRYARSYAADFDGDGTNDYFVHVIESPDGSTSVTYVTDGYVQAQANITINASGDYAGYDFVEAIDDPQGVPPAEPPETVESPIAIEAEVNSGGEDEPDEVTIGVSAVEVFQADGYLPEGAPPYFEGDPQWVNPEVDPRFVEGNSTDYSAEAGSSPLPDYLVGAITRRYHADFNGDGVYDYTISVTEYADARFEVIYSDPSTNLGTLLTANVDAGGNITVVDIAGLTGNEPQGVPLDLELVGELEQLPNDTPEEPPAEQPEEAPPAGPDGLLPEGMPDYFGGDPQWVNPETDPRFVYLGTETYPNGVVNSSYYWDRAADGEVNDYAIHVSEHPDGTINIDYVTNATIQVRFRGTADASGNYTFEINEFVDDPQGLPPWVEPRPEYQHPGAGQPAGEEEPQSATASSAEIDPSSTGTEDISTQSIPAEPEADGDGEKLVEPLQFHAPETMADEDSPETPTEFAPATATDQAAIVETPVATLEALVGEDADKLIQESLDPELDDEEIDPDDDSMP